MIQNKQQIIDKLGLLPHPEGGYYKETYRSEGQLDFFDGNNGFIGKRNFSTCIYFLLTSDNFSAFHRIKQDEIWHFYFGSPIHLHTISPKGKHNKIIIGNNIIADKQLQYVVKAGDWFAAEVPDENGFALVGCTVSPGFDFTDFELAEQNNLQAMFPEHQQLIARFTRS